MAAALWTTEQAVLCDEIERALFRQHNNDRSAVSEGCISWLESNLLEYEEQGLKIYAYWQALKGVDALGAERLRRRLASRGLRDALDSAVVKEQQARIKAERIGEAISSKWPGWDWWIPRENATPEYYSQATLDQLNALAKRQPDHNVALQVVCREIADRCTNKSRRATKSSVVQPVDIKQAVQSFPKITAVANTTATPPPPPPQSSSREPPSSPSIETGRATGRSNRREEGEDKQEADEEEDILANLEAALQVDQTDASNTLMMNSATSAEASASNLSQPSPPTPTATNLAQRASAGSSLFSLPAGDYADTTIEELLRRVDEPAPPSPPHTVREPPPHSAAGRILAIAREQHAADRQRRIDASGVVPDAEMFEHLAAEMESLYALRMLEGASWNMPQTWRR